MSAAECMQFQRTLAYFSAPSLLGIKCANLISFDRKEFDLPAHVALFNGKTLAKGLKLHLLCECRRRALVLHYNEVALQKRLSQQQVQRILEQHGYPNPSSVESCLAELAQRMQRGAQFPHEIGIFLDYPLEDVQGFIENHGENYTLCGYWKVYANAERARHTFASYDKCRKFLCDKLNQGYDIYQALKIS